VYGSFRNLVITDCMKFHTSARLLTPLCPCTGLTMEWHPWLRYHTLQAFVIICWHSFVLCMEFHVSIALKAHRIRDACGVLSSQRASSCVPLCSLITTDASGNQTTDVSVRGFYVHVCVLRHEQILWYVQQGFMPCICFRFNHFMLHSVMLHKYLPTR
jgi:hypothetical protein